VRKQTAPLARATRPVNVELGRAEEQTRGSGAGAEGLRQAAASDTAHVMRWTKR
jgi:hypothetical protein